MSEYSARKSLSDEVNRFMETNRFNPLQVTGFYIQAKVVLNEYEGMEQRITALERENAKLNCMCEYAELALSDLGGERDQLDKENERLLSLGNKSLNSGIETHAENILLRKRITALEKVIDAVIELMEAPPFHVGDYDTIKTAMRAAGYLEDVEL